MEQIIKTQYRRIEKIQYPKLIALLCSIVAAYILFQLHFFTEFAEKLNSHGYISVFLAGMLLSYGFTSPFAVGFFVSLSGTVNSIFGALLGGVGAVISDLVIFQFIRETFQDELDRLKLTTVFRKITTLFHTQFNEKLKKYILYTAAGLIIASPLPDEFGVSLISGFSSIDRRVFALIAYFFNIMGILAIFTVAKMMM